MLQCPVLWGSCFGHAVQEGNVLSTLLLQGLTASPGIDTCSFAAARVKTVTQSRQCLNFHAKAFQLELLTQDTRAGTLLALSAPLAAACPTPARAALPCCVQEQKCFSSGPSRCLLETELQGKVIIDLFCAWSKDFVLGY